MTDATTTQEVPTDVTADVPTDVPTDVTAVPEIELLGQSGGGCCGGSACG